MEPLAIGAERGLPIVDADGVGEELSQNCKCFCRLFMGVRPTLQQLETKKEMLLLWPLLTPLKVWRTFSERKRLKWG